MIHPTIQSYQVFQRDVDEKARIRLADGQVLELPVGGPYTVGDAHDILVGDLWVLAGQSNMEGYGDLVDVEKPSPLVHSLQSREEWAVAEEPLHWPSESPRIVHHKLLGAETVPDPLPLHDPTRIKGAGLGLPFAKERAMRTGVPIGLIPAAHGGTSLEQWDPELRRQGDASLYGALLKRIERVGSKVAGVLWYQGESDTFSQGIECYHSRMNALLKALRRDLRQPELPFYYVQLGCHVSPEAEATNWDRIREAQRTWSAFQTRTAMVSAIDLELDDSIHIGTQGLKRLGRRLANVADGLLAPELVGAAFEAERSRIRVTYQYVRGRLHSSGRPSGFSLRDSDNGKELPVVYKVLLQENTAVLYLIDEPLPSNTVLWYGWGLNPSCNVTDAADAALPAFGPFPLA